MQQQTKIQVIADVLRTRRYATIAVSSGAALGVIYYMLTMSMLPLHLGSGALESAQQDMGAHVAATISLTIVISGLAGVNFALVAFKIARMRMSQNSGETASKSSAPRPAAAIFGGAFAAFTPGCPACTAPLAVILSAVGGMSIFPMQGLELKIVSACVLGFSIWWVARGLQTKSCCKIG